ncbi:MAG: aminotransferase class I/II-fold pyridoxal phosphate-dependent enzyme [Lachnospiraceae bacterium]|nr:aminotransferase class I/II-fold pyridoxal phosphate-dependent enzyme [Lachnospiraceae bacterium]
MIHGGDIYTQKIEQDFSVNMNPYPVPNSVRECLMSSISKIQHYPDPSQMEFRRKIAEVEQVDVSQVIGGNGASELLLAIARAWMPKKALLISPGFYGYRHAQQSIGCEIVEYQLKEELDFQLQEDYLDLISEEVDLLFLTNPNNPTGRNIAESLLERIMERCHKTKTRVVIDECFLRMSDATGKASWKDWIEKYDNLLIVNTFTKLFTLPGVRTGYLISKKENIELVARQLSEWNMSVLAQDVSAHCCEILLHTDFEEKSLAMIQTEREYLSHALKDLGFRVYPSDTSYILFYVNEEEKSQKQRNKADRNLYERLLAKKVLIRDCSNFQGLTQGYYRIAVKNHEDNKALIEKIRNCYED